MSPPPREPAASEPTLLRDQRGAILLGAIFMATFLVGMGGLGVTGTEIHQHTVGESTRLM